ncbi:hypothetical protein ACIBCU_21235 [Streptomyces sp. NPDC051064]|uniref:hypothetical protein n=1 Tax=Streptomyces sp. NPDC051064 TaxID=3365641 RepID=UPI0037B26BDD
MAALRGQKTLQALDFWLRNPDDLADELLNVAESERVLPGVDLVGQARSLLAGDEPDLESYPVVRWRFGAFEQLDDVLGLLLSHTLIGIDAGSRQSEIGDSGRPRLRVDSAPAEGPPARSPPTSSAAQNIW